MFSDVFWVEKKNFKINLEIINETYYLCAPVSEDDFSGAVKRRVRNGCTG